MPPNKFFDEMQHRLWLDLQNLARPRDPFFAQSGYFFVRDYLRETLEPLGRMTVHRFQAYGTTHENLILDLNAADTDSHPNVPNTPNILRDPILIGAHYDTVPGTPGADDNATGLAVLLELARQFSQTPARSPLRLVAFDLEEYGLAGSRAYAQWLRDHHQSLRVMLSLEMLGYTAATQAYPAFLDKFYPAEGNFIALIGNLRTLPTLRRISRTIRQTGMPCEWLPMLGNGTLVPDTRRSDHAPFWDLGYRAIMVTDTANLRNPHYHSASDRLDTLNLPFMTGVCQGLITALRNL